MNNNPTRLAIFFSGRIKAYEKNINFKNNIINFCKENNVIVDFYCSVNLSEIDDYHKQFIETFNILPNRYHFEKFSYPENLINIPSYSWPIRYNFTSMFYNTKKCLEMISASGIKYDIVMKYRTEVQNECFSKFFFKNPKNNSIYIPRDYGYLGYNDQLAFGNLESMIKYSNIYDNLYKKEYQYKCPEEILANYLINNKINVFFLDFKYDLDKHIFRQY